jgi:hypothetical protein
MSSVIISLDDHQISLLEQVLLDRDEAGAWELLAEIRLKVRAVTETKCGI